MNKIKEIEKLLEDWKAAGKNFKAAGLKIAHKYWKGYEAGLKAALDIFNRPSNTQIQTDGLIAHCEKSAEIAKGWPKYKRDCMGKVGHR